MYAPVKSKRKYRFGRFESDSAKGELTRQGERVRLQDQPFRLLTILLEHAGEVISREELRQKLWPADTYVEFDGSLNAALKRLRAALGDPADNPIFIETLPKRGYRFIAPVAVENEPAEAATVDAVVVEKSQPKISPPGAGLGPPSTQRHGRVLIIYGAALAVVLVLVVFASLGAYWLRHHSRPATASPSNDARPFPLRKSVAVLAFHNTSGRVQDDWLATAFSEMLSTELATGEKLRLVTGEEVANLRISSPWSLTSTLSRETAARIGTALNSDVLVLGSYTAIGKTDRRQLRLDVTLQDVRTGEVLGQIAQISGSDDLFRLTSDIGATLRERLGVPAINDTEQAGVLASLPLDRAAARFYSIGIAKLRDFDALAAKDLLEQACKADPKFSLAHVMLAQAWNQLGYEQKRKEEAKKALDLSLDLPRFDRMQVEGDYYESLPDHEKAASIYRALFELFPDSVNYGLQLSAAQAAAGHASQALETLAQLRRLPQHASDDPRIDIAESRLITSKADILALLQSAVRKASAQGKKLVYARARINECMNLVYGEHPERATAPCEDAYNTYRAAGNGLGAAEALRLMADQQGGEGHIAQARVTYQRALKILEGLGEHLDTAIILNNMAVGFTNEGNLDRGEQLYRQAKFHFEQAGDKRNSGTALGNIADIFYLRGNLLAAVKTYEQAIEVITSVDNGDPAYAMYRLADLELAQGHVQDAHRLVAQAMDSLRSKNFDLHGAMSELGDVLKAEGDLPGARQQYQSALDQRQTRGRTFDVAESQASLSELAVEEGHPEQAETLVRLAIAEFEKEKTDPDTASAYTVLSRTLLMEGKLDEARMSVQRAAQLSLASPDPELKLPIAIQTARIEAVASQRVKGHAGLAAAVQRLRSVIASAKKLGYYQIECEARLALAEAELRTDPAAGSSRLKILEKETQERGLVFLSQKAHLLEAASQSSLSAR
jgi:DNA-binding winged helix-turn-helix (wHTH) protein/tetratricopeptide (TPR) repeat protein/TolB-like protein